MSTQYRSIPRGQPAPSGGNALKWVASALAATTVVAGLGWAGVLGGGDDTSTAPTTVPVTTESSTTTTTVVLTQWPATAATGIDLHTCPAGNVTGGIPADSAVVVVGRAEGNAWVAIQGLDDPATTVWVLAAGLTPDPASPAWGDLPVVACTISDGAAVQSFKGKVLDSTTGVPLAGVTLSPTDADGNPQPAYAVVSAADGSYEIGGLVDSAYGIWVDGAAVGYEQGFTGRVVSPLGFLVAATWADGATTAPGTVGDIALDSTGAAPTGTTPDGSVAPTTTVPAGPNVPPTIGTLTADPGTIYSKPSVPGKCKTTSATLSVDITDATGVASVTVAWAYRSFSGTVTLTHVGTANTWQGTIADLPDPTTPVAVALVLSATDTEGMVAAQTFGQSLGLKKCG
jgi:hypothetical protein